MEKNLTRKLALLKPAQQPSSHPADFCILVVDAHPSRAELLAQTLAEYGYQSAYCHNHADLDRAIHNSKPKMVIVGVNVIDDSLLKNIETITQQDPLPVIILAERHAPELIQRAVRAGVSAHIVGGFQPQQLQPIIDIAQAQFSESRERHKELTTAQKKLAERKLIERAKGMLMAKKSIDEAQAYQHLRKMAMDKGMTLATASKNTIDILNLLED
ncbi:MAG: ANTAR domain-containing protein [Gammaproteobacteria bacterium]|nr:ANTAR domain-containing protein [Gammaproteobacteria bacterium]